MVARTSLVSLSCVLYAINAYRPSYEVKHVHNTPHLDSDMQEMDGTFGMAYGDYHNAYTESVQRIPVFLTVFLCVSAAAGLMWLVLSLNYRRFGWMSFPFTPSVYRTSGDSEVSFGFSVKENSGDRQWNLWSEGLPAAVHSHPRLTRGILAIVAGGTFLISNSMFYGNALITTGVNLALQESEAVGSTLNGALHVAKEADVLAHTIDAELDAAVTSATCLRVNEMHDMVALLTASSADLIQYTRSVPDASAQYEEILTYYGREVKDTTAFLMYSLVLVVLGSVYVSYYRLRNRRSMVMTSVVAFAACIALAVACRYVQTAAIIGADFCMAPTSGLLLMAPPGAAADSLGFYVTCSGNNPIEQHRQETYNLSHAVDLTAGALLSNPQLCPGDPHLTAIQTDAQALCQKLTEMPPMLRCEPLQQSVLSSVEDGLCDDMFRGTYSLWGAQLATFTAVFVLAGVASLATHSMPLPPSKKDVPDEEPLVLITDSRGYESSDAWMADMDDIEMNDLDFSNDLDSHVRSLLE